jgi:hypothetical protein
MNSLESVNEKLTKASQLLNTAAQEIRDFGFNTDFRGKVIVTLSGYRTNQQIKKDVYF